MKSRWISVRKGLPKEGEENRVLIFYNPKYPYSPGVLWGYFEAGKWCTQWGVFSDITHWQPLPPPPRVKPLVLKKGVPGT